MPTLRCGLIGCGTVGGGLVRLWDEPGQAAGAVLSAVAVRDPGKRRPVDLSRVRVTGDALALVRDPAVDAVVEATGDTALGYRLAREALRLGKPFVTAAKALAARHAGELERLAAEHRAAFRYEAAVGGALPIVSWLRHDLSPGPVRALDGVLNGTCNFILTRLGEGLPFEEALEQARRAGLAEPDSTRDTSGLDSADKLAILARLLGLALDPAAIPTRGIEGLGPEDVAFGRRRGLELRLLARLRLETQGVVAEVAPVLVPAPSPLAQARDEQNAVRLDAGPAGVVSLVGPGAGAAPTAAALLADVRELARGAGRGGPEPAPPRPVAVRADHAPRLHYVTWRGPAAQRQRTLQRLQEAGVPLHHLESPWAGRVQALVGPVPSPVLRAAVESDPAALAVAVDDGAPPCTPPARAAASVTNAAGVSSLAGGPP